MVVLFVSGRVLLSVLLVMSACSLMPMQMAGSQSISTITSFATTTTQVTIPIFSQSAAATTTLNRTMGTAHSVATTFKVNGQTNGCWFVTLYYNASAGDHVEGNWTSDYALNFYIMSDSDIAQFKYCGTPPSTYLTAPTTTSYSLDWVAPQSGTVWFVFENFAFGSQSSHDATVSFTLHKVGGSSSYSIIYTTVSIPSVATNTFTLSSIYYSTLPSPLLSSETSNWLMRVMVATIAAFLTCTFITYMWPRIRHGTIESEVAEPKSTMRLFNLNLNG